MKVLLRAVKPWSPPPPPSLVLVAPEQGALSHRCKDAGCMLLWQELQPVMKIAATGYAEMAGGNYWCYNQQLMGRETATFW